MCVETSCLCWAVCQFQLVHMRKSPALCRGFDAPSDFTAYSNAKLYNQLTAVELQKRLEGSGVDVYLAQPGMSKTGLFEKGDHSKWSVWAQVDPPSDPLFSR